MMEDRYVIYQNKRGNALYILGSLMFTILSLVLVIVDYRDEAFIEGVIIYWITKALMVIGVGFFGYAFFYLLKRNSSDQELLVINKDGITDYTSALAIGFIPWEDIEEIVLRDMLGNAFVELVIKDEKKYLESMTRIQRLGAKANKRLGHEIVCMTLNTTGKNPNEVYKVAQAYMKEYLQEQNKQL